MKRFEASPEWVRRIREAAVAKRIAHQEVAEFVMNTGIGNGKAAKQRKAQRDYEKKQSGNGQGFMSSKPGEVALDTSEKALR